MLTEKMDHLTVLVITSYLSPVEALATVKVLRPDLLENERFWKALARHKLAEDQVTPQHEQLLSGVTTTAVLDFLGAQLSLEFLRPLTQRHCHQLVKRLILRVTDDQALFTLIYRVLSDHEQDDSCRFLSELALQYKRQGLSDLLYLAWLEVLRYIPERVSPANIDTVLNFAQLIDTEFKEHTYNELIRKLLSNAHHHDNPDIIEELISRMESVPKFVDHYYLINVINRGSVELLAYLLDHADQLCEFSLSALLPRFLDRAIERGSTEMCSLIAARLLTEVKAMETWRPAALFNALHRNRPNCFRLLYELDINTPTARKSYLQLATKLRISKVVRYLQEKN